MTDRQELCTRRIRRLFHHAGLNAIAASARNPSFKATMQPALDNEAISYLVSSIL